MEGSLTRAFDSRAQMEEVIKASPEQQDHYLSAWLASAAEARGLVPSMAQVYAFTIPPVLGGATDVENVELMDFVVYASISAQIHRQVRDLPPGTPIAGVTTEEPPATTTKRRWFGKR